MSRNLQLQGRTRVPTRRRCCSCRRPGEVSSLPSFSFLAVGRRPRQPLQPCEANLQPQTCKNRSCSGLPMPSALCGSPGPPSRIQPRRAAASQPCLHQGALGPLLSAPGSLPSPDNCCAPRHVRVVLLPLHVGVAPRLPSLILDLDLDLTLYHSWQEPSCPWASFAKPFRKPRNQQLQGRERAPTRLPLLRLSSPRKGRTPVLSLVLAVGRRHRQPQQPCETQPATPTPARTVPAPGFPCPLLLSGSPGLPSRIPQLCATQSPAAATAMPREPPAKES